MVSCPHCNKVFSKKGIGSHIWRAHTEEGGKHKDKVIPWNRGLTKNDHPSILKKSRELQGNELYKNWKKHPFLGKTHSSETRAKLSLALSINNKGGRCKWFEVSGQKVQGTWERNIAEKFNELGIRWIKLKTNKDTIRYVINGKQRSYTPDFYLPDFNVYLEIKGRWWGDDKKKMECVFQQYPNKRIIIVEKPQYEKILLGELVW